MAWGLLLSGLCHADTPVIAVASNLISPMTEIATAFNTETGDTVRLSFGSSGNLARQIVQGAPYEVYISAGKEYIDFLIDQRVPVQDRLEYIYGEIGIYVPVNSRLASLLSLQAIINALTFDSDQKIAIANPEHAPYGIAAMQALQNAGIWAIEKNRLILAESVSQIIPYALSGSVDMVVIPYSFILQNGLKNEGSYFPIPDPWYDRINQYVVMFDDASQVSLKFKDFLISDTAIQVLNRYGYHPVRDN